MTGFLTVQEAADLLGLSTPRIYQLVVRGTLEGTRRGKMYFISPASLAEFARSRRDEALAEARRLEAIVTEIVTAADGEPKPRRKNTGRSGSK